MCVNDTIMIMTRISYYLNGDGGDDYEDNNEKIYKYRITEFQTQCSRFHRIHMHLVPRRRCNQISKKRRKKKKRNI